MWFYVGNVGLFGNDNECLCFFDEFDWVCIEGYDFDEY